MSYDGDLEVYGPHQRALWVEVLDLEDAHHALREALAAAQARVTELEARVTELENDLEDERAAYCHLRDS